MALRLSRSLGTERQIDVGYGVSFRFRPFTFAELKEAEATAHRLARESLPPRLAVEAEAFDDEDAGPDVDDAVRGRFAEVLTLLMVLRFGTGWDGVEIDDGVPAPFERQAVEQFLDQFPGVAMILQHSVLAPWSAALSEGKGYAPSPGTGIPVA